jgi:hypothetical protein
MLLEVLLPRLHRLDWWTSGSLGFVLVQMVSLVQEVVVLVVGLESLQEVSLLGILLLVLNTGM